VLAVIGFFSSLTTAIFWGAYLLGKLVGRIERVENELWDHDTEILRLKGQRPGHEHQRH
jgi:hypothetical protein